MVSALIMASFIQRETFWQAAINDFFQKWAREVLEVNEFLKGDAGSSPSAAHEPPSCTQKAAFRERKILYHSTLFA